MPGSNDFLPFATGVGANVSTQAEYAALPALLSGYQSGVAQSKQLNKTWRQSSFVSAAIAQLIADVTGQDVADDGVVANFERQLALALNVANYAVDTGTANTYKVAYSPAIKALTDGMVLKFKAKTANTGASTFSPNGMAASPIWNFNHVALQGGEIVANGDVWVQWNSSLNGGAGAWVLIDATGGNQISGRLIGVQVFTANGTYTPTPGMSTAIVEVQGGGGAGGGTPSATSGQWAAAGGGSSGSYGKGRYTAAQIGASVAVTVGAGGAGVAGGAGNNGGASSFGSLVSAPGGLGGVAGFVVPVSASGVSSVVAPGSVATGGNIINATGLNSSPGISGSNGVVSGYGSGSPILGGGGGGPTVGAGNAGLPATGYGAGGGGACGNTSNAAFAGGAGKAGVVIVWEFA